MRGEEGGTEIIKNNRRGKTKKSAFDDEVTSAQRGTVGFISHYQARQFANTLASLGYNKKFVSCSHYLGELNSAMLFLIVKFVR